MIGILIIHRVISDIIDTTVCESSRKKLEALINI